MDSYIVHAETGEPVTPEVAEAAQRAERIRRGITIWADTLADIAAAYQARDWTTLGYASWETYVAGEFGPTRLRLDRAQRREIVASLRAEHLSTRAIAAVVGASHTTVERDLEATGTDVPDQQAVISIDGRTRPATRPTPPAPDTTGAADIPTSEEPSQADQPTPGSSRPGGLWNKPFEWPDDEDEGADEPTPPTSAPSIPPALQRGDTLAFMCNWCGAHLEVDRRHAPSAHFLGPCPACKWLGDTRGWWPATPREFSLVPNQQEAAGS